MRFIPQTISSEGVFSHVVIRIAPEVFMRITPTRRASEKHYRRLEEFAPKTGTVRVLKITEKQYDSIYLLSGELDYQEKTVGRNCYIMI